MKYSKNINKEKKRRIEKNFDTTHIELSGRIFYHLIEFAKDCELILCQSLSEIASFIINISDYIKKEKRNQITKDSQKVDEKKLINEYLDAWSLNGIIIRELMKLPDDLILQLINYILDRIDFSEFSFSKEDVETYYNKTIMVLGEKSVNCKREINESILLDKLCFKRDRLFIISSLNSYKKGIPCLLITPNRKISFLTIKQEFLLYD